MKLPISPVRSLLLALFVFFCSTLAIQAQTSAFTYQGKLTDGVNPATGTYQMQFSLYDAASTGTQIGATITSNSVTVANGIFSVDLDFGASSFMGADRFLEIAVKKPSEPTLTLLTPRQPLTSAPYSIRSLFAGTAGNALSLNNVPASDYVVTTDTRMTNARPPTAGSGFYIQNGAGLQIGGSFNIDGTGRANIFNAAAQYNIGNNRFLSGGTGSDVFVGTGAGAANPTGFGSTFVGFEAGKDTTTGNSNTFVGRTSGWKNTTGTQNTFVGHDAGFFNVDGSQNTFLGRLAGLNNISGNSNVFVGYRAGGSSTGSQNSFVGVSAGTNTTGNGNSFFGFSAGAGNTTGSQNSSFGYNTGGGTGNDNSFFGFGAGSPNTSGQSNSFYGVTTGFQTTSGEFNSFYGRGAGAFNQTGNKNSFFGRDAGLRMSGSFNTVVGSDSANNTQDGSNNTLLGFNAQPTVNPLNFATAIGSFARVSTSDTIVIGKTAGSYLNPLNETTIMRPADTVQIPGTLNVSGAVTIGNGTPLNTGLNATATLDFPNTGNNATNDLTITVNGAADGDAIFLGVPNSNITALTSYTAWVSAANTVTVRFTNQTGAPLDPGAGTFRVVIMR